MYSELVDRALVRARRPSKLVDAQDYTLASLREIQTQDYCLFHADLIEDQITATADPHIFTTPDVFRIMRTAYYPTSGIYPALKQPGKEQNNETHFYYAAGNYFAFKGVGVGDLVDIAYYSYVPKLEYYAIGLRPAIYKNAPRLTATDLNTSGDWEYLSGGAYVANLATVALDQAAQDLVTNWMIFRHEHVVLEGVVAKILKNAGDDRAGSSFALYKSYQDDVRNGESSESLRA